MRETNNLRGTNLDLEFSIQLLAPRGYTNRGEIMQRTESARPRQAIRIVPTTRHSLVSRNLLRDIWQTVDVEDRIRFGHYKENAL